MFFRKIFIEIFNFIKYLNEEFEGKQLYQADGREKYQG